MAEIYSYWPDNNRGLATSKGQFMPGIYETAYPRLKSNPSRRDLEEVFTPTQDEIIFSERMAKGKQAKTCFLLLLKTFQRLGYFIPLQEIAPAIIEHVAQFNRVEVTTSFLASTDASGSRRRHIKAIREYCGVLGYGSAAQKALARAVVEAARTKEDIADLINVAIEELVRQSFELPAFGTIHRAARSAKATVNRGFYRRIAERIDDPKRKLMDALFCTVDHFKTPWDALKREPGKPTRDNFRDLLNHLQELSRFILEPDIFEGVPESKLKQFALEAKSLDAARMANLEKWKRAAFTAALIRFQKARCLDDLGEMFIKRVMKIHHNGRERLDRYRVENQNTSDELLIKFQELLLAYREEREEKEKYAAIGRAIDHNPDPLIEKLTAQIAYAGNNYFSFLYGYYKNYRPLLFDLLNEVELISTTQETALPQVIQFLKQHQMSRAEWIECPETLSPSWVSEKWWKLVTGQNKKGESPIERLNRRHFEVCAFSQIMSELKSGDLAIVGSDHFSDYRTQLISWEEYHSSVDSYSEEVGLAVEPTPFIQKTKQWLQTVAATTDKAFPKNEAVRLENGEPILTRLKKKSTPANLKAVERSIAKHLEEVNILDCLVDTEKWLNWTKIFGPLSGFDAKIEDPAFRYVVAAFCYGCNLGPSQTARSIEGIDRRQIAWVNQRHVTEGKLDEAISAVINAYNRFPLPKFWGSGKHAAADGTKWNLYEQNLLSEYHIRYGGYGGIGYYHVSDNYIALFSHFIPCGVWEAVYILDGLLKNESDIQPDTLHADTQGQSTPVFGLSYLLGIELMPRIRNWKDLKLFKSSTDDKYEHIDSLFSDEPIDWNLIQTHLPDMLRVALSIKMGRITASTILKRLGTYSRKNRLYFAFCELGRAVRTGFLLKYISSQQLRSLIQSATNKSESFNGFVKWVSFGGQGIIGENNRDEQRKIIKYNHLVSNLLILHTVHSLTRVLPEIEKEGLELSPEVLSAISPYLTEHINRFGDYHVDFDRKTPPLQISENIDGSSLLFPQ